MRELSLALRFMCELAALVAVGWWGWTVSPVLGVLLPVALAVLWGAAIAPKARRRLSDPARLGVEPAVFAGATAAFAGVDQTVVAIAGCGSVSATGRSF